MEGPTIVHLKRGREELTSSETNKRLWRDRSEELVLESGVLGDLPKELPRTQSSSEILDILANTSLNTPHTNELCESLRKHLKLEDDSEIKVTTEDLLVI